MADRDLGSWWKEVREDLSDYLQARAQLTKLEAYEKIARVLGVVISFLVLAMLAGFVIIFILIMIGSWILELTGSVAIAFSSVAAMVIVSFVLLAINRKVWLQKPISNSVITALFDEEDSLTQQHPHKDHGEEEK